MAPAPSCGGTPDGIRSCSQCEVFVNTGPDGSRATFTVLPVAGLSTSGNKLRPQSTKTVLDPLERYAVRISGWSHHSAMYYSVWFSWETSPASYFQLTLDSATTTHVITAPAHTRHTAIQLLVRATDEWECPHTDCAACTLSVPLEPVAPFAVMSYLNGLLSVPWQSGMSVLEFLAVARDFENVDTGVRTPCPASGGWVGGSQFQQRLGATAFVRLLPQ